MKLAPFGSIHLEQRLSQAAVILVIWTNLIGGCRQGGESSPKASAPNKITEKFIQLAEKDIFNDPSSYLWSHDRWKHQKPKK